MFTIRSHYDLQDELEGLEGLLKAYWQPPETLKMAYPSARVTLSNQNLIFASNAPYRKLPRYEVLIIDPDPDSEIHDLFEAHFKYWSLESVYSADNLNHWLYTIYYG